MAPYGSGALCTGIAAGIEALHLQHQCKVYSVEPATAAPFSLSKRRGERTHFDDWEASFCDGCGGMAVLEEIWPLANRLLTGGFAVPLDAISGAIKLLVEKNHVVAEGAGACSVAAAVSGMCGPARRIVSVVSGAGLDTSKLVHILEGKGVPLLMKPKDKPSISMFGKYRGFVLSSLLLVTGIFRSSIDINSVTTRY